MMDFDRITGFDWDMGSGRKSLDKHDVSQSEAEQVFFNDPLIIAFETSDSQMEGRYHSLGVTDEGRQLHVTFTLRANDTLIRVISARAMSRKERNRYAQEN